jgi:hypothetical protein
MAPGPISISINPQPTFPASLASLPSLASQRFGLADVAGPTCQPVDSLFFALWLIGGLEGTWPSRVDFGVLLLSPDPAEFLAAALPDVLAFRHSLLARAVREESLDLRPRTARLKAFKELVAGSEGCSDGPARPDNDIVLRAFACVFPLGPGRRLVLLERPPAMTLAVGCALHSEDAEDAELTYLLRREPSTGHYYLHSSAVDVQLGLPAGTRAFIRSVVRTVVHSETEIRSDSDKVTQNTEADALVWARSIMSMWAAVYEPSQGFGNALANEIAASEQKEGGRGQKSVAERTRRLRSASAAAAAALLSCLL